MLAERVSPGRSARHGLLQQFRAASTRSAVTLRH